MIDNFNISVFRPLTETLPIQKRALGGLVFKIFAWACAIFLALIVVGAAALFVSGEIDAAVYCVRPTYHSAECKDIRHLQLAMIVFGGAAAMLLLIQTVLFLRARRRRRAQDGR